MRGILITSLLLLVSFSYSQNKKADSLQNVLNQYQKKDTIRVNLLNTIGFEYWISNANQSINFGQQALDLSKTLNYAKGQATAQRIIGVAHWAQGNQNEALRFLTHSQQEFQKLKDDEGIANTMLNIGMVYADLKEYDRALENYNNAIDYFTALGLKGRIATTFTKMGTVFLEQDRFYDAKEYISNALKIHKENDFTYGIAEAHNRLGILYIKNKEFAQAKYHIERSITTGKSIDDRDGITSNLIQYGKLLRYEKNYEAADIHLQLGLKRAKKNNLKKYELQAYNELKELRKEQGKPEEALAFYDQYIALKDSVFNTEKSKQIAYLEFEKELESQNRELVFLKEKEKTDALIKWSLMMGIIILVGGGFLVFRNLRQRSRKNNDLLEKSNELLQSKAQLAQQEMENATLKQQELKQQLNFKNKELTSYAINFVQKNELLEELRNTALLAKKATPKEKDKLIDQLNKTIRQHLNIDKDWEDFKRFFEEVYVGFYAKLKAKHPDLSANDLKVCSLTRLNLNVKETASILGISPESAKTARYRLRKKLALSQEQEIFTYLLSLEN